MSLNDGARMCLASLVATTRANLTVAPPFEVAIYSSNALMLQQRLKLEADSVELQNMHHAWESAMRLAFRSLLPFAWEQSEDGGRGGLMPAPGMSPVSTGHLPVAARVQMLVQEAHQRFAGCNEGANADYIPVLAEASPELFGLCVAQTSGELHVAGDVDVAFSIQSISKPLVFGLICQSLGEHKARELLGVNSTGLPFNSVMAVERSAQGQSNPMVNAGAIATVSLAPGKGALASFSPPLDEAGNSVRWQKTAVFLAEALGLNLFASRPYPSVLG